MPAGTWETASLQSNHLSIEQSGQKRLKHTSQPLQRSAYPSQLLTNSDTLELVSLTAYYLYGKSWSPRWQLFELKAAATVVHALDIGYRNVAVEVAVVVDIRKRKKLQAPLSR